MTAAVSWIDVEGAANMRDVAGLPTADGRHVRAGRLIRSDNLQTLTEADVRLLVDELRVRSVADLRTGVEVGGEGPGPMTREPLVDVRHLSLFQEPETGVDVAPSGDAGPVVLPWQERGERMTEEQRRRGAAGVYLTYLADRPDSMLAALRLIAGTDGATIVHCAAGKDRTGVVVAFALAEVGVTREAIVADYARTAERIEGILARLAARRTYADDVDRQDVQRHTPRAETMVTLLDAVDAEHGGVPAWLRANGWTEADAAALRAALLTD
jgi:protein-tyrosine phosphatase